MADMEKVIKGLETIKQFFGYGLPSTAEMFDSYYGILNDAITLLKEQEPMEPIYQERSEEHVCQKCGRIVWKDDGYCSKCGQKIKWK